MSRRSKLHTFFSTVLLVVAYFVVPVDLSGGPIALVARGLITCVGVALAAWLTLRQIGRQLDGGDAPLLGLLLAIISSVLVFALADFVVATTEPGEFAELNTRIDGLYYALTTLATVGYGDVHAQGQFARGLMCVQLVFNVAIIATAASVLGRRLSEKVRRRRSGQNGSGADGPG
ncbi:potassium channel family protein [Hamadaea tsunoensis]|uniref:potassium channel family protein n=1 Tax=Hamadaea tsunoensis TaxID=53368 RepID=UPI00040E1DA1|nr:potassium channel family protein [Hamadaea tsunoensis]